MATPRESRRGGMTSLPQMLPNIMTLMAICAGLTAIRFAVQGRFDLAVSLILVAAVLDGLDGRLARMLKTESQIGAELDSLADFVNFGVAPGLLVYLWALQDARSEGWIAVLIYVICCVMRLARFNVDSRNPEMQTQARKGFVGVPSPAGALLVLTPFFIWREFPGLSKAPELVVVVVLIGVGFLLISRIPTPSLKSVSIPAGKVRYLMVGLVAVVAAAFTWPWAVLSIAALGYFALVLVQAVRSLRGKTETHPE